MPDTVIRSRERIFALLSRLRDHHSLILIHARQGKPEPSLSMLLSIDTDGSALVFDSPVNADSLGFEPGSELLITASLQGVDLRFRCRFEAFVEYDDDTALRVRWPEQVDYLERRHDYRVRISNGRADIEMHLEDAPTVEGDLLDLSLGGFGALVEDSPILQTGEVLDCCLEFHEGSMTVRAEIRRKHSRPGRARCHVGARFLQLDPRQKQLLGRIVAGLERKAIRTDPTR